MPTLVSRGTLRLGGPRYGASLQIAPPCQEVLQPTMFKLGGALRVRRSGSLKPTLPDDQYEFVGEETTAFLSE